MGADANDNQVTVAVSISEHTSLEILEASPSLSNRFLSDPGKAPTSNSRRTNVRSCIRFVGFADTWLPLLYWFIILGFVITSWIMVRISRRTGPISYGLVTAWHGTCSRLGPTSASYNAFILAVNLAAAIVVAASDNSKSGLIAPSPRTTRHLYARGTLGLGVDSVRLFGSASVFRKTLYLMLLATSLPIQLL